MKKNIMIFLLIVVSFLLIGCSNDSKKVTSTQIDEENNVKEDILKDASNLKRKIFKDGSIEGLENVKKYLLEEKENIFAKKYIELYNKTDYENSNDFLKHLIETYSYYCVMEGYTGTSDSGIYGWSEDNSFQADIYVKGYDVQTYNEDYNILPDSEKRTIMIVEKKYEYSKPIYVYHEVTATVNEEGKTIYDYNFLNWGTELHVSGYKQVYADSYIVKYNKKNKEFSNLLYKYGYEILGGGKEGTEEYKKSVQTAINTYEK